MFYNEELKGFTHVALGIKEKEAHLLEITKDILADKEISRRTIFTVELSEENLSNDGIVKTCINIIYSDYIEPNKWTIKSYNSKLKRAQNYVANHYGDEKWNNKKSEKYLLKIKEFTDYITELEMDIKDWKRRVASLYQLYSEEYLEQARINNLKRKQKENLEELMSIHEELIKLAI
ncbi:hypothetical protein [Clostridium thailandense]|uniref:hypothetical protein n=1 Tax=Clostridium thailandense TaxID=2794346 RepID=UPI003988FB7E